MAKSKYELIVVGAGVVGMGIALAAHKKGVKKIFTLIALLAFASSAYARDTISIVGSSTVFPYATIGAETVSYTHLTLPTKA